MRSWCESPIKYTIAQQLHSLYTRLRPPRPTTPAQLIYDRMWLMFEQNQHTNSEPVHVYANNHMDDLLKINGDAGLKLPHEYTTVDELKRHIAQLWHTEWKAAMHDVAASQQMPVWRTIYLQIKQSPTREDHVATSHHPVRAVLHRILQATA